jgi:hypothetical protein
MKKLILFLSVALTMFFAASCDRNELLDPEQQRPVLPSAQPSVVITGDGLASTRSTTGRVEFTGGYATGAGMYDGKAEVTVKAVPYSGYRLVSFTGGPVGGNSSQFNGSDTYDFKINDQDWQFSVSFKQEFTITVSAESGGIASGSGTYVDGGSCTVIAVPEEGKILDGWYENDTKVSSDLNYTFTVSSNRTSHVFDKHLRAIHNNYRSYIQSTT